MILHDKNYILISELAHKSKKHISFFLNMIRKIKKNQDETHDFIKYGQHLFVHKDSQGWTPKYKVFIKNNKFEDYSKCLPLTYLINEYKFNKLFCEKMNYGETIEYKFSTKKGEPYIKVFFKFNDETYNKIYNKTWYLAKLSELEELEKQEKQEDWDYLVVSNNYCIILY